jgi:mannose-1-phosphate guanylyltransferase/mannose-1-phosphate guanylyltransferase/mannose-6-phosphate isomerase
MLQMTAQRVADPTLFDAPMVVASERHADEIDAQLAAVGIQARLTLLEPMGRNTAAAIALAALEADPAALLLVMPSDHVIGRPDRFLAAVEAAAAYAEQGYLLTFGITPDGPETGYGYIKSGAVLGGEVCAVDRFVEKPDRQTATRFLDEGGYHWNGGIFLLRADAVLAGLERHAPGILSAVRASLTCALRSSSRVRPDPARFAEVRSQSIDHALMEVHDRVAVVPVAMDWSDVGSWDALYEIGGKDEAGNAVSGSALLQDTRNCLIHTDGPMVVALGVSDLVVVATGDAILVLPRGDSQRVKEAVDLLKGGSDPGLLD